MSILLPLIEILLIVLQLVFYILGIACMIRYLRSRR